MAENGKGNEKGFYKHISSKSKTRENVGLLMKGAGDQLTEGMEKAKILNAFVFTGEAYVQESKASEISRKILSDENLPSLKEDQGRKHLNKLNLSKSMEHDGMHHWPTSLWDQFCERFWQSGEVPDD